MSIWLPKNASRSRIREAENARRNRREVNRALAHGQVSRRELLKWGLITAGGALMWKHGFNPFVRSAYASIPTGLPLSPLFGQAEFSQAMPRHDVLPRIANPMTGGLTPTPMRTANLTLQTLDPRLPGVTKGQKGPIEGRPHGEVWAHQRWNDFLPRIGFNVTQESGKRNTSYNPQVPAHLNSDIPAGQAFDVQFHPKFPVQGVNSVWTFNGTVPPKLALQRYGEPVLLRHHNKLPFSMKENGVNGFGRHTISTHEHNGHHVAENDGFTGAYFWPGQFYDYHW